MTKTGLEFRILVIVICLIFVICDLEFLILQHSNTPTRPVQKKSPSFAAVSDFYERRSECWGLGSVFIKGLSRFGPHRAHSPAPEVPGT